ncbi:MAG TPA: GntR family transcriptional regulator, partial [Longimicrobium sp.]|nr:GntR family transcriptional regulator [Longimicrobium sp.]
MKSAESILTLLRNRIVSALHLGLAGPGDPLPSIRELSRDLGVDHRALARAYRALEAEGLVEVRERAGVYFAEPRRLAGGLPLETAEWLADTLAEAWRRRLDVAALQQLIRRAT